MNVEPLKTWDSDFQFESKTFTNWWHLTEILVFGFMQPRDGWNDSTALVLGFDRARPYLDMFRLWYRFQIYLAVSFEVKLNPNLRLHSTIHFGSRKLKHEVRTSARVVISQQVYYFVFLKFMDNNAFK